MNQNQPKPIEPGCLCLIIAADPPEFIGRQCTAIRPLTSGETVHVVSLGLAQINQTCWIIELPSEPHQFIALESQLRRIDGHLPEANELTDTIPALQRRANQETQPNA